VVAQKDREMSNLRSELASARQTPGRSQMSGSSLGKIVAASAEADADRRLSRLEDIFREINAAHADQTSVLNKQLEQTGEALQLFKEHAKKQFENQQQKVRPELFICTSVMSLTISIGNDVWFVVVPQVSDRTSGL